MFLFRAVFAVLVSAAFAFRRSSLAHGQRQRWVHPNRQSPNLHLLSGYRWGLPFASAVEFSGLRSESVVGRYVQMMHSPSMIASVALQCTSNAQRSLVLHPRSSFFQAFRPRLVTNKYLNSNSFETRRQTVMVFNNYQMGDPSVGLFTTVISIDMHVH